MQGVAVSTIDTIPRVEPRVFPPQPKRSRFGSYLGGAVLVVLGGLWALDLAGTIDVRLAVVLPSLLIIFGLALIIGATEGPHSGLVVAGLFLSIAVVIAAAVPATSTGLYVCVCEKPSQISYVHVPAAGNTTSAR